MLALAGMWIYDLHLYTVAYLTRGAGDDLLAMRGAILAMLVPLFALASRRNVQWRMQLSRAATFQSLSVMAILGYLIVMMSATRALEIIGGEWVRIGQIGLVFVMTVTTVVLLPSAGCGHRCGSCSPSIFSSIATIIARNGSASPTGRREAAARRRRRSASGSSRRSPTSLKRRVASCSSPTKPAGSLSRRAGNGRATCPIPATDDSIFTHFDRPRPISSISGRSATAC